MSKRKNLERARNGLLFRDGKYVSKEELEGTLQVIKVPIPSGPYYCTKCKRKHIGGNKFKAHRAWARADIEVKLEE